MVYKRVPLSFMSRFDPRLTLVLYVLFLNFVHILSKVKVFLAFVPPTCFQALISVKMLFCFLGYVQFYKNLIW